VGRGALRHALASTRCSTPGCTPTYSRVALESAISGERARGGARCWPAWARWWTSPEGWAPPRRPSPGLSRMSKCSVLDLPHVISSIVPGEDAALVDYIVPGDMMEYIPPADAVFLKVCNC
jgi:hypothetical protein